MKKVRSPILALIVLCLLLSCQVYAADNTDLPIYTQSIKEREQKDNALTDAYQISILTKESNELQDKIQKLKLMERKKIQQSLLTEQYEMENAKVMVSRQAENMAIFREPHIYSNIKPAAQEQTASQIFLWSIVFVILGGISFFAALALQQRKRGRENVCNNYNEAGEPGL